MITIRPDALYQHLEFDKVATILRSYCLIEDTKIRYFPLHVSIDKAQIDLQLDQTLELKSANERNELPPLKACSSITEDVGCTS